MKSARTDWRPSWKQVLGSPIHFLAFGAGTGLSPRAPGTAGTLVGIPLWFLFADLSLSNYLAVVALMFLFGCWVCGASARKLGVHDYGGIVFDEIVGYLITCIPLLAAMEISELHEAVGLGIAFVAFRLFDIWKPWPIGWLDQRVHGGFGIMLDDVIAGIYAALTLTLGLVLANEKGPW